MGHNMHVSVRVTLQQHNIAMTPSHHYEESSMDLRDMAAEHKNLDVGRGGVVENGADFSGQQKILLALRLRWL